MIEDKICHLTLSWTYPGLPCITEKCMAWVPECPRYRMVPKNEREVECTTDDCLDNDREYLECGSLYKGGCRLI